MKDKKLDPSLQAPQEANTTKHLNFLAMENADDGDTNNEREDESSGDESPTKKAWEELRKENKRKADSQE